MLCTVTKKHSTMRLMKFIWKVFNIATKTLSNCQTALFCQHSANKGSRCSVLEEAYS